MGGLNQKLDISQNNGSMILNNDAVPISPIKPSNVRQFAGDNSMQLNASHNTLNLSNMAHTMNPTNYANESRLSVNRNLQNMQNVQHETQITVIGFPPGEASFIHRKFRSYGTVINSEWSKNALFLEYEHKQNAVRALAENAKWIKNGHLTYMIAVMYAELTDMNPNSNNNITRDDLSGGGGRMLNLSEMYKNSYSNHTSRNVTSYFGQNYDNVEKPPAIQSGIFWKIFNFITTGW